jgi:hypothetical protein
MIKQILRHCGKRYRPELGFRKSKASWHTKPFDGIGSYDGVSKFTLSSKYAHTFEATAIYSRKILGSGQICGTINAWGNGTSYPTSSGIFISPTEDIANDWGAFRTFVDAQGYLYCGRSPIGYFKAFRVVDKNGKEVILDRKNSKLSIIRGYNASTNTSTFEMTYDRGNSWELAWTISISGYQEMMYMGVFNADASSFGGACTYTIIQDKE